MYNKEGVNLNRLVLIKINTKLIIHIYNYVKYLNNDLPLQRKSVPYIKQDGNVKVSFLMQPNDQMKLMSKGGLTAEQLKAAFPKLVNFKCVIPNLKNNI